MPKKRIKSVIEGPLTPGQKTFGTTLAKKTGLSPKVIGAWMLAEESSSAAQGYENKNYHNWLNIGPFMQSKAFNDPKTAAKATAKFIKDKKGPLGTSGASITDILKSAGKSDQAQMQSILNSGWGTVSLDTYNLVDSSKSKFTSPVPKASKKSSTKPKTNNASKPTTPTSEVSPSALLDFINQDDKSFTDYLQLHAAMSAAPPGTVKVNPVAAEETKKKKAKQGAVGSILPWAQKQTGTQEGTSKQAKWATDLGNSPSDPWCSIFVAQALKSIGKKPPSGAAYSGTWLNWSGAKKVSTKNMKPGDIVVFDWGDGGMTDHVAIYAGNGQVVGGNQSNAVTKTALNKGAVVGVRRPK